MPKYNALADRPSNMLAYPDTMRATPRNEYLGALADLIAQSYSPVRTQQMQGTARFLSMPAISQTLDRLSYGEPLTTGAGGLGGTTRVRPEALEAAMAVAPMAQPTTMATLQAARAARQAALQAGRAGERYAERVVPQIMERGGMPAEMLNALANRTISPLDVYHGTPHRFAPTARNPLGEFDASKIGTGEGAQVYGHGLYVAENPAVAKGYQETLAGKAFNLKPETERLGIDLPISTRGEFMRQAQAKLPPEKLARNLQNANIDSRSLPIDKLTELFKTYQEKSGGNLYKADLPDKIIPKMLDYDKHLSEQSPEIQKILLPYQKEIGTSFGTGGQILKEIAFDRRMKGLDDSPAAVAQQLREMGIPGVRYLDEKSRSNFMIQNTYKGKPYGEPVSFMTEKQAKDYAAEQIEKGFGVQEIPGTRNFVVFPGEEKRITILERQGK
jgi:hypothetical protein